MTYENDYVARYLAMRVLQNKNDTTIGVPYEEAIKGTKTTKNAIDWWIKFYETTEQ
ncbi:MAG: hypothetical protein AB9836_04400 [Aminipila sp.]